MAVLKAGSVNSDVKELQQMLKDAGFDPGPIDGIYGPKTRQAVWDFQKAANITVDGIAGPQTMGALAEYDPASTSATDDSPLEEEFAITDEVREYIQRTYPQMAWALDHEELGAILAKAGSLEWDRGRIAGAIQGTDYWAETSTTQRSFDILENNDPAEWQRQLEQRQDQLLEIAKSLGLTLNEASLTETASQSLRMGMDTQQMQTAVINAADPFDLEQVEGGDVGGQLSQIYQGVQAVINGYLLPIDDITREEWITDILNGEQTVEAFENYAQQMTLSQNPWMKTFIDQGLQPNQALQPYRNQIAKTLERNPSTIDFQSEDWQQIVKVQNEDGTFSPASFQQVQENIRKYRYDEWNRTGNAKQAAASLAGEVASMFGRRG